MASYQPQRQAEEGGREAAFLRLMEEFQAAIWRLVSVYTAKPADREDLFQEIALAIWKAIPQFRGDSSERTWLYRIAHNVALSSQVREGKHDRGRAALDALTDFPSRYPHPEQQVLVGERHQLLVELARALPAGDRQVLLLHLEGLSDAEVAEISGVSIGAVATRLSRTRSRIAEKLRSMGVTR